MGQSINAHGQIVTFPDPTTEQRAANAARATARKLPGYVSQQANALRNGGITVTGIPVGTDTASIPLLTGAHDYLQANPSATVQFVISPAQAVTLTAVQVGAMWAAVVAFVQACFAAEASANAQVMASPPTITDTAQVDALFAAVNRVF